MARIRSIKPEYPKDELMGSLPRDVRLLYVLIWTMADDEGRFRAAPGLVRAELFPYDDDLTNDQVGAWLGILEKVGRIRLYAADGQRYGCVIRWRGEKGHQRIEKPTDSRLPAPPANDSPTPPGILHDSSTTPPGGIGVDWKGEEGKGAITSPVVVPTPEAAGLPGLVSTPTAWPSDLEPVRLQLERLQAPGDLLDPAFWRTVDEWLGKHPTVGYLDETAKYLAHQQGMNRRRQHKNHKSGLSNWFRVAERIAEREAQKRQQWQRR